MSENKKPAANFIRHIVANDVKSGKNGGKVVTRFPPEPNGYLHIGHAKAIWVSYGIASEYGGEYYLRFDDTNPEKEDVKFAQAIERDIKWLGYDWKDRLTHASDYFEQLYDAASELIRLGKAYVCELNAEEIRKYRGTLTEPGKDSPYRDRPPEENIKLFEKMRDGGFKEGKAVLRAKIDMSSPNINMRDPVIYRVKMAKHHRTGDKWVIYPMYDFTHCLSDSFEKITHSLCTLEFEDHRPLYDWFLETLKSDPHPQQIEFSKLRFNYIVQGKRKMRELVGEGHVAGWDDPRMPTLAAYRRLGYTPKSIRTMCERIGVTKKESVIELGVLEGCIREDLEESAKRAMCVLRPLKLVIENYPEDKTEMVDAKNHPKDDSFGKRKVPFSREVYIEQDDFSENPPPKYKRLSPGKEVRLRYSYIVKCKEVIKEGDRIKEIRCTYDPDTLGKKPADGRKVNGIIHWVSAKDAIDAEVRLYDRLFKVPFPEKDKSVDYKTHLNPDSLVTISNAKIEPSLLEATPEDRFQFERLGYFCTDSQDHSKQSPVFNRTVTLRDTWAKIQES